MSINALSLMGLAEELEAFIRSTIPKCHSVAKYGGTLFTLKPKEKEGQFCGVFIYNKHVQISFSRGVDVYDPKKLLLGSGKLRRHINFTSIEDVKQKDLKNLLVSASKL